MEYEGYQVSEVKAEPRYGRRDGGERNPYNENFRRRSPGKNTLLVFGIALLWTALAHAHWQSFEHRSNLHSTVWLYCLRLSYGVIRHS